MSQSTPSAVPPAVVPEPGARSFILGSTGSGKSTIGAEITEEYRYRHPSHKIVIYDPKRRFVPTGRVDDAIFPDGPHERVIGRDLAVRVNGHMWRWPKAFLPMREISVYQGDPDALFEYLYQHGHARRPVLVLADETLDLIKGVRGRQSFRTVMQLGRARRVGMLMINQAPRYIDSTMKSDVEYLYVGRLGNNEHNKYVRRELVPSDVAAKMPAEMEQYWWFFVDRVHPARSRKFTLSREEAA